MKSRFACDFQVYGCEHIKARKLESTTTRFFESFGNNEIRSYSVQGLRAEDFGRDIQFTTVCKLLPLLFLPMPRPTLLVAEREPIQALSVRKLVLETAKYNVLTAHSTREALDLFQLFPNISLAVLAGGNGVNCDQVAKAIKAETDKVPIVFLHAQIAAVCKYADHQLSSYEPEKLLELIRSLLGDPRDGEETGH